MEKKLGRLFLLREDWLMWWFDDGPTKVQIYYEYTNVQIREIVHCEFFLDWYCECVFN